MPLDESKIKNIYLKKDELYELIEKIAYNDDSVNMIELIATVGIHSLSKIDDEIINKSIFDRVYKKQTDIETNRINNLSDNILNINKYQQEIKANLRKSYLTDYFEKHFNVEIKEKELVVIQSDEIIIDDSFYKNENGQKALINKNIVTSIEELRAILNISKGTVNSWRKSGIIKKFQTKIKVSIKKISYNYRGIFFKFYDLEDIKKELRARKLKQN